MSKSGDLDIEVNGVLWSIGWKAKEIFGALAIISLFILVTDFPRWVAGAVFVAGVVIPLVGLLYVWTNLKDIHDTALEQIHDSVEALVGADGEDIERYSLLNNAKFGMLLPPHEFYATTLVLTDTHLIIHDGGVVELPKLKWSLKENVFEYPFDRMTDLDYEPAEDFTKFGQFAITLEGEEPDVYQFSRAPDEAFEAVRRRFRSASSE